MNINAQVYIYRCAVLLVEQLAVEFGQLSESWYPWSLRLYEPRCVSFEVALDVVPLALVSCGTYFAACLC